MAFIKLCQLSPKVLFWNKWRTKTKGGADYPSFTCKMADKNENSDSDGLIDLLCFALS